jgi:hypothetical protein
MFPNTARTCQPKAIEDDPKTIQLNVLHMHEMRNERPEYKAILSKQASKIVRVHYLVEVTCQYNESLFRFMTHSVYTAASADSTALNSPNR